MKKIRNKIILLLTAFILTLSLTACSGQSSKDAALPKKFPAFTATDLKGNKLDDGLFKENTVTVVNLWFTGCEGCVQEMPKLEKLSKQLESKGGRMIGICVDATDKDTKKQASGILKKNGATYTNLSVDESSKAQKFLDSVTAFPTTLLVDRNGKIIGKAIVGSIDTKKQMDRLMKRVDDIVSKDGANK